MHIHPTSGHLGSCNSWSSLSAMRPRNESLGSTHNTSLCHYPHELLLPTKMKISLNCSKKTRPIKDTISITKLLRLCKVGDTFITTRSDREITSASGRVGCKVTTMRRQLINLNMIESLTIVEVIETKKSV